MGGALMRCRRIACDRIGEECLGELDHRPSSVYDRLAVLRPIFFAALTLSLLSACAQGDTVPFDDGSGGAGGAGAGSGGAPNTSNVTTGFSTSSTTNTTGGTTGATTGATTGVTTGATTGSTTAATTGATTAATTAATTSGGGCAHDPCAPGGPLDQNCDLCVLATCAVDSTCCDPTSSWDIFCVVEASAFCGC